jgi:EAL domain-containing protein (putative c-di-GMP-specific phosphodiesterase class I)
MESSLENGEFKLFLQPKYNVKQDKIDSAEALVRWFHPEVGFISPGLFVPIFEKNGFITMLDLFVWEEACKEVARLRELGLPQVPISVNASRLDFDLEDLPERFAELADKYGVDHRLMHVELTETAYSDNPDVVKMLATFKELGFSTELDDFGSGYSSLVSLNTLPLDVMKLDMSMIRKATELDDFRIVESTINLARVLGLKTVVEGVETAEEAARVTEMGCDYIQGYFYSRPLRKEEFEEYLEKHIGT